MKKTMLYVPTEVAINNFATLVFSRSSVRLETGNYSTASDYRSDRRSIEKDTQELRKAWHTFNFRMTYWPEHTRKAFVDCMKRSRFSFDEMGKVEYTAGQYYPIEIRGQAVAFLKSVNAMSENLRDNTPATL